MFPSIDNKGGFHLSDVLICSLIIVFCLSLYLLNNPSDSIDIFEGEITKCLYLPGHKSRGNTKATISLGSKKKIVAIYNECKITKKVIVSHKKGVIFRNNIYEVNSI